MEIEFKEYSKEELQDIENGYIVGCYNCVYFPDEFEKECDQSPCTKEEREDKKDGYYIEVPD
jgi:hypothetical protein